MSRVIADGLSVRGKQDAEQSASEVPYSNATSGLTATDTQAAIDETVGELGSLKSVQQVSLSSTDYTLTATDLEYRVFELTGTLTASVNVIVPDSQAIYTIINNTTGAFTVTVKTSTGSGVVAVQGTSSQVRSDGVNVVTAVDEFAVMPTVGGDPIVESGGNADGEWTRWADGTQICRGNVPSGSAPLTKVYPMSFNTLPSNPGGNNGNANSVVDSWGLYNSSSQTQFIYRWRDYIDTIGAFVAIGTWK